MGVSTPAGCARGTLVVIALPLFTFHTHLRNVQEDPAPMPHVPAPHVAAASDRARIPAA